MVGIKVQCYIGFKRNVVGYNYNEFHVNSLLRNQYEMVV